MKIAIMINKQRMTPELTEKFSSDELTQNYDITYDLYNPEPNEIEQTLNEIKTKMYNAYLIGGGDGTVRSAFQILQDSDTPIAILPLGTFNLLAKSLDYPKDIDKLFEVIKNNKTKLIDLIEVNDQVVINHAWIGLYFYIMKLRDKHKEFLGKSKLLKSIFNSLVLFKLLPIYQLEFEVDGKKTHYATCLVYIGNNEFYTGLLDMGERKTLSSGLLSVTILNVQTRWELFLSMLSLLFGKAQNSKYVTYFCTDQLTITAQSKLVNMVIDGELFKLESPLRFYNHQKKIKVLIP